ncbi:hypothetical protein PISMIDRAFT_679183 [Pisolithus microcarpus 441]|uniref:Uncharacterized protein n=1 Tax=Pisolithus microcarpus 441 TaxID=765257 RepID=A0A0C9YF67_9AGAM|nr:hypothetical protein PISMIDRAFT_679183 [Pisolithus microcarpus 441]
MLDTQAHTPPCIQAKPADGSQLQKYTFASISSPRTHCRLQLYPFRESYVSCFRVRNTPVATPMGKVLRIPGYIASFRCIARPGAIPYDRPI